MPLSEGENGKGDGEKMTRRRFYFREMGDGVSV